MSPAQKLKATQKLYEMALKLKEAGLRMAHPDWSQDQIKKTLRDIFLYART